MNAKPITIIEARREAAKIFPIKAAILLAQLDNSLEDMYDEGSDGSEPYESRQSARKALERLRESLGDEIRKYKENLDAIQSLLDSPKVCVVKRKS